MALMNLGRVRSLPVRLSPSTSTFAVMKPSRPENEYSFSGLEGFITAKVLVEGLKRTGKDLTRPKFIKAMEAIRDLDVGDYFVSYRSEERRVGQECLSRWSR